MADAILYFTVVFSISSKSDATTTALLYTGSFTYLSLLRISAINLYNLFSTILSIAHRPYSQNLCWMHISIFLSTTLQFLASTLLTGLEAKVSVTYNLESGGERDAH